MKFLFLIILIIVLFFIAIFYLSMFSHKLYINYPNNPNNPNNQKNLKNLKKQKENFRANSNLLSSDLMNFEYITNPNYTINILNTYYLDDDKKINGIRNIEHPLILPRNSFYGYYWHNPQLSNNIYASTGIRL